MVWCFESTASESKFQITSYEEGCIGSQDLSIHLIKEFTFKIDVPLIVCICRKHLDVKNWIVISTRKYLILHSLWTTSSGEKK